MAYTVFGDIDLETQVWCRGFLEEYCDCISSSLTNLGKTHSAELVIRCIMKEPATHHMPVKEKKMWYSKWINHKRDSTRIELTLREYDTFS